MRRMEGDLMDALVSELSDQVAEMKDLHVGLLAEIRRIRAAAQHVLDKSAFANAEELEDLGRALRKLQMELDRFAPSSIPVKKAKKTTRQ